MTEALKPLNWDGFGEDTLCEGEVWFHDAWVAARISLELPSKIRRSLIGSAGPPNQTEITIEEQERAIGTILEALCEAQLVVYARHPQTDAKRPVEPERWHRISAALIGDWDYVPVQYSEDFGPFVNRRLRIDGALFLEWLEWMRKHQGNHRKLGRLKGFELIDRAKQQARHAIKEASRGGISATVPQGYVGIDRVFSPALDTLYPEQIDQSEWQSPADAQGWTRGRVAPDDVLSEWEARRMHLPHQIPISPSYWMQSIALDTAKRLDDARKQSGIRVFYWSNRDACAFDVPDELLDPCKSFLAVGRPWVTGQICNFFGPDEWVFLDGAAAFVEEGEEQILLDAFLRNARLPGTHTPSEQKRRGPKKGGGYKMPDRRLFPEMTSLINSDKATSPYGAALMIGERLPGNGTMENRAKRVSSLYIKEIGLSDN
jgi:hypothetical protein